MKVEKACKTVSEYLEDDLYRDKYKSQYNKQMDEFADALRTLLWVVSVWETDIKNKRS